MADEPGAEMSTGDLVLRALGDDPAAWESLLQRYECRLWTLLRSFRLSAHDAQDVAQDVWLIAAQRLPALRDPACFGGWLCTIARNECLRHLRVARRCVPVSNDLLDRPHENGPESVHAEREGFRAVRAALDRLGEPDRQVAALRLAAPDLGPQEVADLTGVDPAALPAVRRRAFRRLRAMLDPDRTARAAGRSGVDPRKAVLDVHRRRVPHN